MNTKAFSVGNKESSIKFRSLAVVLLALLLTACIGGVPDQEDFNNSDFSLAVDDDNGRVRNLATVSWDDDDNQLIVRLSERSRSNNVVIRAAGTNQLIANVNLGGNQVRVRNSDDDDDDDDDRSSSNSTSGNRTLRVNLSPFAVPCQVVVSTSDGVGRPFNVRKAPSNCLVSAVNTSPLIIKSAKWDISDNKLKVKGYGADLNQLVTIRDAVNGTVLGSAVANSVGIWKLSVYDLFVPPCSVTATVVDQFTGYAQSSTLSVRNSSINCSAIPPVGNVPGGTQNFLEGTINVIPGSGVIQNADGTVQAILPASITFQGGAINQNNAALNYFWTFDGAVPNSLAQNPTVNFNNPGVFRVTLTVSDSFGNRDLTPATMVVIVSDNVAVNRPTASIVSPVSSQTISAGQSVYFSATGYNAGDIGNQPLSYVWDFDGGSNNTTVQNPGNVVFYTPGTYSVRLIAVDAWGRASVPDVRIVQVTQGTGNPNVPTTNQAPIASITSPTETIIRVNPGGVVNFSGFGSDYDNHTPLTYRWDFSAGAPVSVQQTAIAQFNTPGTYLVTLTVFDSLGLASAEPAVRVVIVGNTTGNPGTGNGTGNATIGDFSPNGTVTLPSQVEQTIQVGQSLDFRASGVDANGGVANLIYMWDFDDAAPDSNVQNPGMVTFNQAGVYRVRMTVRNSQGYSDPSPETRIIRVLQNTGQQGSPMATINTPNLNNQTISVGDSLNFSATATSSTGQVITNTAQFIWDFAGAREDAFTSAPGNVIFSRAGTYDVTLFVKDNAGRASSLQTRRITVQNIGNVNQAPKGAIQTPLTDVMISSGDSINFYANGSDPDNGTGVTYTWAFTDINGNTFGAPASRTGATPGLVTFNQPGVYTVKLEMRDSNNAVDPKPEMRTITVTSSGVNSQPPTATITTSHDNSQVNGTININQGTSISFQGTGTDPDGTDALIQYYWTFSGAAADSDEQFPGNVLFNKPGTFTVSLNVIDESGVRSSYPATRTIRVQGNTTISNQAPNGQISQPVNTGTQTISLGDTIVFEASATDTDNNYPLTLAWDFDTASPSVIQTINSAGQTSRPGNVTFTKAGTYTVRLNVIDSTGAVDSTADTRTIIVAGTQANNNPPNNNPPVSGNLVAVIDQPVSNQTINVGASLNFSGSASGTAATGTVKYYWDFYGLSNNWQLQNPGNVVFTKSGVYEIRLRVVVNEGTSQELVSDYATRTITVQ